MKEFKFTIDGHKFTTTVNELEGNMAEVTVNGTSFKVQIEKDQPAAAAPRPSAHQVVSAAQQATAPAAGGVQVVKSPLPGSIIKVNVKVGDTVKVGDELLTMESMKMENSVKSEFAGVVKAVYAEPGKNVMQEDKLVEIASAAAPAAAPQPAPAAPKADAPKPAPAPQPAPAPKPAAAPAAGVKVTSPLPGSVIRVAVSEGQAVKKGDTLLILESMKMENPVLAEQDGVVKQIAVSAGQNVMQDDLLIVLA